LEAEAEADMVGIWRKEGLNALGKKIRRKEEAAIPKSDYGGVNFSHFYKKMNSLRIIININNDSITCTTGDEHHWYTSSKRWPAYYVWDTRYYYRCIIGGCITSNDV